MVRIKPLVYYFLQNPSVKMVRIIAFIIMVVWGGLMAGCTNADKSKGYISNIELMDQIQAGKAPVIVDVRSTWEYENGHIPGAIHIPFWTTYFKAEQTAASANDTVVVYCEHGPRAGIGKFGLSMAGLNNVIYLKGHMAKWTKAGLAIKK